MIYEVMSGKFTAYLMMRQSGDPPANQSVTTIPKGSQIVLVESRNPDHVEFTLGPNRYWTLRRKWNDAYVRAVS